MRIVRRGIRTCFLFALGLLPCGHLAAAQAVPPVGTVITETNVSTVTDLISPIVEWCVKHGMQLTIGPYKKIEMPKAYVEATEKYAGQVKLTPEGTVEGYVAGLPFPTIDPNDPNVALKLAWNFNYRPYLTDDWMWRNFPNVAGSVRSDGPMDVDREFTLGYNSRLYYTGRLYVDPKPVLPNQEGFRYKEIIGPILDPLDLKGINTLNYRYMDPHQQDDTWLYFPNLRRVRRLSTAQRSDAILGQEFDIDSNDGYSGSPVWMTWRFLGEKQMLLPMHAQSPAHYCPGKGDFALCDVWEPRDVWIIEGTSKLPQYAFSKRVLFIDKETYWVTYADAYDKAGEPWKGWIMTLHFARRPWDHPGVTVYQEEQAFNPGVMMVDIQLQHATKAWSPAQASRTGDEEMFNVGPDKSGVPEAFYTVAHLIAAGR